MRKSLFAFCMRIPRSGHRQTAPLAAEEPLTKSGLQLSNLL